MLDIWTREAADTVERFAQSHAATTGESLDPARMQSLVAGVCPYDGYDWMRVEIDPQIVKRPTGEATISTRSISYFLRKRSGTASALAVIPLSRSAKAVAVTNKLLGFRVSRENVLDYILFIGHLYNASPFYFFTRLSHVSTLLSGTPANQHAAIKQTVLGVFRSPDGDALQAEVEEKKHFLMGNYFLVRMPCLFRGTLYITRLRVAEDGHITMENDDALNVQGIFDSEESLPYYPLDPPPGLAAAVAKVNDRVTRLAEGSARVLVVDTVLQWLLLPLFLFTCFVLVSLGPENPALVAYLRELRGSTTISVVALVLGASGTLIAAYRFVFLEFIIYVRKLIPSVWAQLADALETQHRQAAENFGIVVFVAANTIEFLVRTAMVLSLLIYGLSAPPVSWLGHEVHFGTAIAAVVQSTPLVGGFLEKAAQGSSYAIDVFSASERKLLAGLVSFMLGTICVGVIGRVTKQAMAKT